VLFEHIPASVAVGGLFWWFDPNPVYFFIALVFGWLVDVDHLFDYLLWVKRSCCKPSIRDFISGKYFKDSMKIYVPFHAWEWALLLVLIGIQSGGRMRYFLCATFALMLHLIHDQLTNKPFLFSYLISYRVYHDNRIESFCRL